MFCFGISGLFWINVIVLFKADFFLEKSDSPCYNAVNCAGNHIPQLGKRFFAARMSGILDRNCIR